MAKILAGGVGLLVAATLLIFVFVPDIEVSIPEDEVRDRIEDAVPLKVQSGDIELTLTDADVDFLDTGENGQVALEGSVKVSGFGLAAKGDVDTVTGIRYGNGAFYLSDVQLDDLTLKPTLATKAKIAAIKKAWQPVIDEFVEGIRETNGDASFEEVKAELQASLAPIVRESIENALRRVPVYRLRGSPAKSAARLILKDISFSDTEAVAVLSPAQAMIKIATGVIGGLIVLLLIWEWYRNENRQSGS